MDYIINELDLIRLNNLKQERIEIKRLKSKFELFDINRFSLNKDDRGKYRRNILIVKKLNKLIKYNFNNPFNVYISNIKKERYLYDIRIKYLNNICSKNNIPNELIYHIREYL